MKTLGQIFITQLHVYQQKYYTCHNRFPPLHRIHQVSWLRWRGRGFFKSGFQPGFLGNSGLCWTVFAWNRDTTVPAEGDGDLQTLICVLVARPRRCLTLSNPVPWQNWMTAYLGYTLRIKMLFCGWPVMVHDTHTRRRRSSCRLLILHVQEFQWVRVRVRLFIKWVICESQCRCLS